MLRSGGGEFLFVTHACAFVFSCAFVLLCAFVCFRVQRDEVTKSENHCGLVLVGIVRQESGPAGV